MSSIKINSESELKVFAFDFVRTLRGGDIVGLVGDLGAGKTTFVKYIAEALGIKKPVRSPTFIIMQIFDIPTESSITPRPLPHGIGDDTLKRLVHIDAYRIKDYPEFLATGFLDYANKPDTTIFIEWPDRVPEVRDLHGYRELRFAFSGEERVIEM